jgi:hypothetical protein
MMHELAAPATAGAGAEAAREPVCWGPSRAPSCGLPGDCDVVFSVTHMFRDLERSPGPFSAIAGHYPFGANPAYRGQSSNGEALRLIHSGGYPRPGGQTALTPMTTGLGPTS